MNSVVSAFFYLLLAVTPGETPSVDWGVLVLGVLPWLLIIVLIWLVIWWLVIRYQVPIQRRSFEHMDRLEAKTDETIELLKQINNKLDRPDS